MKREAEWEQKWLERTAKHCTGGDSLLSEMESSVLCLPLRFSSLCQFCTGAASQEGVALGSPGPKVTHTHQNLGSRGYHSGDMWQGRWDSREYLRIQTMSHVQASHILLRCRIVPDPWGCHQLKSVITVPYCHLLRWLPRVWLTPVISV